MENNKLKILVLYFLIRLFLIGVFFTTIFFLSYYLFLDFEKFLLPFNENTFIFFGMILIFSFSIASLITYFISKYLGGKLKSIEEKFNT